MFEFLINAIASFLGGYFSQKTIEKKITKIKFFFSIFFIILTVSFSYQAAIGKIETSEIMFGVFAAFICALFCSFFLHLYLKMKK